MKCCTLIEQFLCLRPQCKISIAFTCVYRDFDQQHRSALSRLFKNASVIRLDVFREEDWKVLQDMRQVTLTLEQYSQMRHWDEYWRYKLDDILGRCRVVEALSVSHILIINEVFCSRYVCFIGFGGLGVACWPLVPKFAGSNPAEAVGFLGRKNPQRAFLRRGSLRHVKYP